MDGSVSTTASPPISGASTSTQAGFVVLNLDAPSRVEAPSRNNILERRELCKLVGQVPNVVFPSGMIVERYDAAGFAEPDSRVLVYYGAADTCIGLATTTVREFLSCCDE